MPCFIKSIPLVLGLLVSLCASAASSDWYLYFWSESYTLDGDAGQFETTDKASVFVLKDCVVPGEGIHFGVHNSDWSTQYGWKDESVSATGVEVELASATQANGWLALPAGTYDVTFNSAALTIRFDVPAEEEEPEPEQPELAQFLRGGDLSMVTYLEDWGTVFRYQDGTPGDVFDILQTYGVNCARLRVYNAPGTAVKEGSSYYRTPKRSTAHPEGYAYAGPEDVLSLARRAKEHGMQICLSIYLSDYWSGATAQYIPSAWSGVKTTQVLSDSVYNYVTRIMTQMKEQGTTPEYVSVGNESNYGILFNSLDGKRVSFGGHTDNIAQCVMLFNSAYDAIKAVSSSTQVIIHHSYGHDGRISSCRSFFQNLQNNGGKFDIVGGSYYPHWASKQNSTDNTPTGMLTWAADMKKTFGKPVMVMEVGYSWTQYRPYEKNGGNYMGQLELNGSYNEATEAGQETFFKELHEAIASDDNILGYLYWDPVFVDQKVNGKWTEVCWAEKYDATYDAWWQDGNVISNTTLFNYSGYPLGALYREIASYKSSTPETPTAIENTPSDENESSHLDAYLKILRDGQILILRDNRLYTLTGQEVK